MNLLLAVKNKINKRYVYLAIIGVALFAFSILTVFSAPTTVYADHCGDGLPASHPSHRADCENGGGGTDRRELCPDGGSFDEENNQCTSQDEALAIGDSADESLIEKYVNPLIAFLAAVVGLVVTISIVIGGIQYSSAGSDPQKVAKAKGRIVNALIALLTFLFLFTLLEWIIPGGLIN